MTQGIGFIDEKTGWIGGSSSATYETTDSGDNWKKVKDVGKGFNNFQFFGDSLAYGVGFGVFKFSKESNKKIQKEYYEDGTIRGQYSMSENGKRDGAAKIFYRNGEVESEGYYKDNLKNEHWLYYNESGVQVSESTIRNGIYDMSQVDLKSFTGSYRLEGGGFRKVLLENKQLYSQRGKGKKLPIFPESDHKFYYGFNPDITIEFIKNDENEIVSIKTYQGGKYSAAVKVQSEI